MPPKDSVATTTPPPVIPRPSSDLADRVRSLGVRQLEDARDVSYIPQELTDWAHSQGMCLSLQAIGMVEEGKLVDYAIMPVLLNDLPKDALELLHTYGFRFRSDGSIAKGDCLLSVQSADYREHKLKEAASLFAAQDSPDAVRNVAAEINASLNPVHGSVHVTHGATLREFLGAPSGSVAR